MLDQYHGLGYEPFNEIIKNEWIAIQIQFVEFTILPSGSPWKAIVEISPSSNKHWELGLLDIHSEELIEISKGSQLVEYVALVIN